MDKKYYIGLMSGTSCDAIDAVLVDFINDQIELIATHTTPIPLALQQLAISLNTSGTHEIQKMGMLDIYLGEAFAKVCSELLAKTKLSSEHIQAIGSHGQTIRHSPTGKHPFTLQIGDPNIIAARTGITTVADFRRKDIALKGQGAPLTPGFHAYLLKQHLKPCWILNIGGIANLTWLPEEGSNQNIIGFDTGPGNCLLDAWCYQHKQQSYDTNGHWAESGNYHIPLLQQFSRDPYFKLPFPKSTGRDYFNLFWLNKYLDAFNERLKPADIQATLLELTARTITQAIEQHEEGHALFVCGGGCRNGALMNRLQALNPNLPMQTTQALGIPPEWIEASAFAWLAHQTLQNLPGNIPSVTGASKPAILGGIFLP